MVAGRPPRFTTSPTSGPARVDDDLAGPPWQPSVAWAGPARTTRRQAQHVDVLPIDDLAHLDEGIHGRHAGVGEQVVRGRRWNEPGGAEGPGGAAATTN